MATISMDHFVYRVLTAHIDWPLWKQRLQFFFTINRIGFVVITADLVADPPVVGETTNIAHGYLMVLGGPKIVEINNASVDALNYVQLVALIDARFANTNPRIADVNFRSCLQAEDENLSDYSNRLKILATAAGLRGGDVATNVVSVIYLNTRDDEIRMKCLDPTTTLDSLITWHTAHALKLATSNSMAARLNNANGIYAVRHNNATTSSSDKHQKQNKCFLCGYEYPHEKACPARGKTCNKCGKLNHFESVCKSGNASSSPSSSRAKRNNSSSSSSSSSTNFNKYKQFPNNARSMLRAIKSKQSNDNDSTASQRNIEDLSEDELLTEFQSFFEQKQKLSSTTNGDNQTLNNITVDEEIEYLNHLSEAELLACPRTFLSLKGKKYRHLVDTGTNLNIISSSTYGSLDNPPSLKATKVKAFGFHSRTAIPLQGEFTTDVAFLNKSINARYLVLDGHAEDIIGYSTATALGIVLIKCDNNSNSINNVYDGNFSFSPSFRIKAKNFIQQQGIQLKASKKPLTTSDSTQVLAITSKLNNADDVFQAYPTLFSGAVGRLKDFKVTLRVDPSVRPVQQPAYPIEFALWDKTKAKLDKLEESGVISRVNGENVTWVCPLHPVGKFDADKNLIDVRITCNAKTFNKALLPHKRHIPSIPELTHIWEGCQWFGNVDFNESFHQCVYDDQGRMLNVMTTPWGLYCWNCLNMGILTASEIFQEVLEKVLYGIPNIKIALDDVAIGNKTKDEHEATIKLCLDRILASGMTLNKKKCQFFQPEIDFFGVRLTKDGVKVKKEKFKDFQDCMEPTNTKEVRSFLGVSGYFKNRSPYQSSVSKPLRDLIKGKTTFKWEEGERKAYEELKRMVIEEEMAFFNSKLPTELYVDAGPDGCSSFLTQLHKDGTIKLVRCDSHAFTNEELQLSHLEKEAFACVWACKTNHIYVYGRRFDLITDALAVKKIFEEDKTRKRTPIRFIRWKSDLSVYNVRFIHREGSKNIADYLSRRFQRPHNEINVIPVQATSTEELINAIVEECLPSQISINELITATNNDMQIMEVKRALKLKKWGNDIDGSLIKPFKSVWNELSVSINGVLMRNDIIVIPSSLQAKIIDHAHEGHMGMQLCKRLLRNICWFPTMDTMIDKTIEDCVPCAANTLSVTTEPIIVTTMPANPWEIVALDHTSKSPTNDYGLGVVDEGSRTTIIKIAKDLTSATAITLCNNIFAKHGIPKVIKTDNGPAFTSGAWSDFAKKFNFKHQKVTPLHPAANSTAERIMKNNNKTIRCAGVEGTPWKTTCSLWLKRYNQTPHSSTLYSPNMLLQGEDKCDILPTIIKRTITPQIQIQARLNDAAAKAKMKKYADAYQHVKHRLFKLNDPVMLRWNRTNKYMSLFDPVPYRITAIKGTMITATRHNNAVTRNCKFFKIISEQCYTNALALDAAKQLRAQVPTTKFTINHDQVQRELRPYQQQLDTPPETPFVQQQQREQLANHSTPISTQQQAPSQQVTFQTPIVAPPMPPPKTQPILGILNNIFNMPAPPRPQPLETPIEQQQQQRRHSTRVPRTDYTSAFRINKPKTH